MAISPARVEAASQSPIDHIVEQIRALLPGVVTANNTINWDELKVLLDPAIDQQPERYRFTWAGKTDAIRALRAPSWSTLVPQSDQSINFDATQHLFLEGDNLEVLKLLYKPYFGRVKMIYIDPPYNTGNDFIYPDNFADPAAAYLAATGQADGDGNRLTTNAETSGRYHSAWLTMLYPRLFLARQLLRDDGVIAITINDHETHNLRVLMNEIFGEENFIACAVWQKAYVSNMTAKFLSDTHDYVLLYARNSDVLSVGRIARTDEQIGQFQNPDDDPRGPWKAENLSAGKFYAAGQFEIVTPTGRRVAPPVGRYWRCNEEQYRRWLADGRITFGKSGEGRPMLKKFLSEVGEGLTPNTWWDYKQCGTNKEASLQLKELFGGELVFDTPKPVKLVRRILDLFSDRDATILDFFAGSCSTAEAVLAANREDGGNRRFIMVQIPEPTPAGSTARNAGYATIADIGKERIRRVCAKLQAEQAAKLDFADRAAPEDLGFRVFTLAPSNLLAWQPPSERTPDAYLAQLEQYTAPLLPEWQPAAVLWEVIVKEGLGLSSTVDSVPGLSHNTVYRVDDAGQDQSLLVCLDDTLQPATVARLQLGAADRFVCRDTALTDDLAANLALQCQLKTI